MPAEPVAALTSRGAWSGPPAHLSRHHRRRTASAGVAPRRSCEKTHARRAERRGGRLSPVVEGRGGGRRGRRPPAEWRAAARPRARGWPSGPAPRLATQVAAAHWGGGPGGGGRGGGRGGGGRVLYNHFLRPRLTAQGSHRGSGRGPVCRPPSAPLSGSPPPHMLWVLPVGPVSGHPLWRSVGRPGVPPAAPRGWKPPPRRLHRPPTHAEARWARPTLREAARNG